LKRRYKVLLVTMVIFIGVPLFLWLAWFLTSPKPLAVFVMDKTYYYSRNTDNKALSWVKKHHRYVKKDGTDYLPGTDYYGFVAQDSFNYLIRDLSTLNPNQIQQIAFEYDAAYFIDSYGIYSDVWNTDKVDNDNLQKIYGGINWEDLLFWEYMISMDKLLIAENIFLPLGPEDPKRKKATQLLGIEWKGWTGRFFHTLNIQGKGFLIPSWMPRLYEEQYAKPWEFRHPGIVLVHEDGAVIVLEQHTHLKTPNPQLRADKKHREYYGVSDRISYPGWF
jgi:hypothetical protein